MGASAIEFRFRVPIIFIAISLGFWSPWIETLGLGQRISLLEWLPLEISRTGLFGFAAALPLVICIASLLAALGVALRLWGTAYLGHTVVNHAEMKANSVMADGPYRYMRNPLYLGTWMMVAAMAFVMPPTGALFVMLALTIFELRLILGEEAFLLPRLGEPYRAYLSAVPRLIPRLRSPLPPSGARPHWLRAIFAELNPIGVFITLAVFSWTYDHWLMVRAILITFGVSLVVRAVMPRIEPGEALPNSV